MAIFAIAWAALAPTLTFAIQSSGASGWVELCGVLGSRWVQATGLDTGVPQPASHGAEHCPYCSLPSLGLVPSPQVAGAPGVVLTFLAAALRRGRAGSRAGMARRPAPRASAPRLKSEP